MRDAFLDLFGLPKNASEEEIKKRYRELAMKLHPDVNDSPNAPEQFRLIQKAYEYLTDESKQLDGLYNQYKQSKAKPEEPYDLSPEEKKAEMRERARYFSKAAQQEAKQIEEDVFKMLTNKTPWTALRVFALFSILFGAFILVDFLLPIKGDMKAVEHKVFYQLFDKKTIFFEDDTQEDVSEAAYLAINGGDSLSMEYSPMLNEFIGYRIVSQEKGRIFVEGEFNLFEFYPLFPLLFILPLYLFFFKENEVRFYLLYLACFTVYPALILHYLLKEDKLKYLSQYFSGLF